MQASDAADPIREIAEEKGEHPDVERLRNRAALLIAFMAMLLAITSLGGGNATEDMLNANIHASDTWAFYQAKNIRQTDYALAADNLEMQLAASGAALAPEQRKAMQERLEKYRANVARYDSEPDPEDPANPLKGEGKKELRAQAEAHQAARELAQAKDPNFDFAEALFQIAIVLGSVAILANSGAILGLAFAFGGVAAVLMLNGFFLFFRLPF